MDKALQTMIDNLEKNTGKTLQQWIDFVETQNFAKHGEIIKFLKEQHGLTHGFANLIALKTKKTDAGSAENPDDLITKQYQGKEQFKPIYDKLIATINQLGDDLELAPKNAYMSVRRKKQFAILHPVTKTRFELQLNLKGQEPAGKLESISTPNSMCSHKIILSEPGDIDNEVVSWIKKAYEAAG